MSEDKVYLKIIQPTSIKVEDYFEHVIIPGIEGDFGVSAGHTPVATIIRPGNIILYTGGRKEHFAVHDGFVTVENDRIIIVCDKMETAKEIDLKRAESAKARAEKRMKSNEKEVDFRRAESALRRALVRIKTVAS